MTTLWSTSEKSSCQGERFCKAGNQAVLQSVLHTYSWLCKVNRDTKRTERKQKHIQEINIPKSWKASDHFARESLWSTQHHSREESRIHMERYACRNTASGPIWARRQSLSGMAWPVTRHEQTWGYNALRDGLPVREGKKWQTQPWQDLRQVSEGKKGK